MTHTLWHRGSLIGETDFEEDQKHAVAPDGSRRHLAGIFRPTALGRRLLPRLCGILSASADLREELFRRGLDPDDASPERVHELFETTAAGARMLDIGRVLSEVEVRAPDGARVRVASIGFIDIAELSSLGQRLDCGKTVDPKSVAPGGPEFVVSVTLRRPVFQWPRTAPVQ